MSDEAAVRAEPSHDAKIIAPPRAMDDEVIVEEVSLENDHEWAVSRLRLLDTGAASRLRHRDWAPPACSSASDLLAVLGDSGETPSVYHVIHDFIFHVKFSQA